MNKTTVFDFKLRRNLGHILSTVMWKGVRLHPQSGWPHEAPQRGACIGTAISLALPDPLSRSRASQNRADQACKLSDSPKARSFCKPGPFEKRRAVRRIKGQGALSFGSFSLGEQRK